ncbi:MAG: oligosaccharide flippase family protein [Chloroflexi bacterium]|nr:oligosaccharide flippase family protein [Chloroflexota bacterium]
MIRKRLPDLGIIVLLLLAPLLLFAPVALGNRTIVPVDVLFSFEPYRAAAEQLGVGSPQNHLVADLVLENYVWKRFFVESVQRGEMPLWDPFIFSGHPFLANGQHSMLYPLSVVFFILPLWRAFGVFIWLQLGLAGAFMYLLARVLGSQRLGGTVAGITFQFSGFMVVSAVHPMIIAGASWLPYILAMAELVIRQKPALGQRPATLPWVLLGAAGLGCQMLAGHAENTYFVLLVTGAFILWRLLGVWIADARSAAGLLIRERMWHMVRPAAWLILMLALGLMLGSVQFLPLYEVVSGSFRGGEAAATLEQVRGWAYPWRRIITFGIPNFFGGPMHHGYFDVFSGHWVPAPIRDDGQYIDWGIKNYVEGGAYLGLLPLCLAAIAVIGAIRALCSAGCRDIRAWVRFLLAGLPRSHVLFFLLLALFSLGCIFGTPIYALVYALPLLKQSHSPFRWIFPLTVSVAVLAGHGMDSLARGDAAVRPTEAGSVHKARGPRGLLRLVLLYADASYVSVLAGLAFWGGVLTLMGLAVSRVLFGRLELWVDRLFRSLALAPTAFPDHRAFYSYEFKWCALFGVLLMSTGLVLRLSRCRILVWRWPAWRILALVLLLADFFSFGAGVNPAVQWQLLQYVPPVVEFLQQDTSLWRYATFTPPGTTKTMNANVGMLYDLQCVAGYDSLFSAEYARYMDLIETQDEQQYNRIASFRNWASLDSPLTDLLNVKYIITEVEIPNPAKYRQVYQDESVRVYENLAVMPRAFTLPRSAGIVADDVADALRTHDVRHYVILESADAVPAAVRATAADAAPQSIVNYAPNELIVHADAAIPSWLVIADSYDLGWKAFIRPQGSGDELEQQVEVWRVDGAFRGVSLEPGSWIVRFKYSPDSVKLGGFIAFIAVILMLFLVGIYLWRFFYREDDDASNIKRVAKNSIAPIVINLFTRSIEMAFAALAARILGPVGNGRYATAINIYVWFDIVANFGLDMYLMREVARDSRRGRRILAATTQLRLVLYAVVIPVLGVFLAGRQALAHPLPPETIWAVVLLYVGLLPSSVANGLAALFRSCEKHEYPAAIQTITTIIRVALGVLVLVGGTGIVGLAGASILTNLVTLAILAVLTRRLIWPMLPAEDGETGRPWALLGSLDRLMLSESWPLMASLLLQALFPGINIFLLQGFQGDAVVGWYDAARKWVDALNIVPSFFTFAVFPIMSRQADQDVSGLTRSYRLSIKLLTVLTLPLALTITLLATPLVGLLSGQEFLPYGATILRLLIWSIVFGWINSLTNYVLIALRRQRYVLLASAARVLFTIAANALFVGAFSYVASAWIMVVGEFLLLVVFAIDINKRLGSLRWSATLGRPCLAGLLAGLAALALSSHGVILALVVSWAVYLGALILLRVLTPSDLQLLAPLMPSIVAKRLRPLTGSSESA